MTGNEGAPIGTRARFTNLLTADLHRTHIYTFSRESLTFFHPSNPPTRIQPPAQLPAHLPIRPPISLPPLFHQLPYIYFREQMTPPATPPTRPRCPIYEQTILLWLSRLQHFRSAFAVDIGWFVVCGLRFVAIVLCTLYVMVFWLRMRKKGLEKGVRREWSQEGKEGGKEVRR